MVMLPLFSTLAQDHNLRLLPRVSAQKAPPLALTGREHAFLQHKRELTVGIPPNELPPQYMCNIRDECEGLSIDYISQIARQLGVTVQIQRFPTHEALWAALAQGKIDAVPSVDNFINTEHFTLTDSYAREKPVLGADFTRPITLPDDLTGRNIAMVRDYLPLPLLRHYYPRAHFRLYDNDRDALSAVAFGRADVYLGNSYTLSRNFLNNLRLIRFSTLPDRETGFAISRNNPLLLSVFNKALTSIPDTQQQEIARFWQPDRLNISQSAPPLNFTPEEQRWIAAHPTVSVVLYSGDKAAPVTIIDNDGRLRGMAGDLLSVVSLKTGLRFQFSPVDTTSELLHKVRTAEADMFASMTPSMQRAQQILFTRPYLRSAFALTTRADRNDIHSLPDLRGKRLAMVRDTGVENQVRARYPEITIVPYENATELMNSVLQGKTDAAVSILVMADYQIKTHYPGKLRIVATVGDNPAWLSFGVGRSDPQLQSILDKVLLSIPPAEIESLANRWRPSDFVVVDSFWSRYRDVLIASAIFSGLMILLSVGWALYLRQQIKRKAALRRQLNDQLFQLRAVVSSMPFPVSLRDRDGRLTFCNQRYLVETGVLYEEVVGKTMVELPGLRTPEQAAFYHRQVMEVIATGQPVLEDRRYDLWDNPDSAIGITVYQWIEPWHDSEGNVLGVIGGWMDISEREALFAELREAKERAEDSSRAKSVFLSTMSHEIRTPMNAIIGMLDMALKKGRSGEQDLQALEVAYESAESLVGLIGDILDISRIEGGQLDYHPQPVEPVALIDSLLRVFQGLAIDKNITLSKHFPGEPQPRVLADPLRIKQVISNLLSNAIKFTDRGGVSLTVLTRSEPGDDTLTWIIEVQDTGIGIDDAQQTALFQPFSQADNRRAGTGLGLYISRTICEKMDGTLTLTSQKGVGTCVKAVMRLPRVRHSEEEAPAHADSLQELPERKVLVVDDNAANRILLAKQLAWLGQKAQLAADGYEALRLWQQQRFDIIITDCNMPGLNGYQLTQILREAEQEQNREPAWIIGFTANATRQVLERCLAEGMNSCLFKPCSINSLSAALSNASAAPIPLPVAAEESDIDQQMEDSLRALMIATLDEDLNRLAELRLPDDRLDIADLAHRIAGSLRIARRHDLAEACLLLEKQCRETPDLAQQPQVDSLYQDLRRYLTELKASPLFSPGEDADL
ncbi:transporter substrate-binding domain-containing protein [Jejubacter calystegiae]|uniref:histidine kinase n=2 Tax=Jejubacter calystegiae TaxID=2579935 RepID=A0A4P8YP85_9ENTR|nr:transporter substrate-binding domain-containing protein [Jejubacter calystegiae]